jgi:hypothetical protein
MGGFSSLGWDSDSGGVLDINSFIFDSQSPQFIFNLYDKDKHAKLETNIFMHHTMGP